MSNANAKAMAFFQKKEAPKADFNLLPQMAPVSAVFEKHELNPQESQQIEQLLLGAASGIDEEQLKLDIQKMKTLTSEVKSISKQGIILIGERIKKARDILSHYGEEGRTFTSWLLATFGSRRTAYNTLSYYEFYQALPSEGLKEQMRQLPLKAAYTLASRRGSLEEKIAIIEKCGGQKPQEIIETIQEVFPVRIEARELASEKGALDRLEREITLLKRRALSEEGQTRLKSLMAQCESLCHKLA